MGRSRYTFHGNEYPYFMTCTVLHWIPIFTRPETVDILLSSLRFLIREGFVLYAYVILENHLHIVAYSKDISRDIARFKSFTAGQVINYLKEKHVKTILDQLEFYMKSYKTDRKNQLWEEGVHPEMIQNYEMLRQKIDYIHNNPVKRGFVDLPEHWKYSSARNYVKQKGLIDVFTDW